MENFRDGKRAGIKILLVFLLGASSLATAQATDPLHETIWNQEQSLAKAEKDKDRSYFEHKLDDRIIYVAYDGLVFTKSDIVKAVSYIDVSRYSIENMKVRALGSDAALATYDLVAKGSIAMHNLPDKQYTSSVCVKKGGDWLLIFHQSTPAHH